MILPLSVCLPVVAPKHTSTEGAILLLYETCEIWGKTTTPLFVCHLFSLEKQAEDMRGPSVSWTQGWRDENAPKRCSPFTKKIRHKQPAGSNLYIFANKPSLVSSVLPPQKQWYYLRFPMEPCFCPWFTSFAFLGYVMYWRQLRKTYVTIWHMSNKSRLGFAFDSWCGNTTFKKISANIFSPFTVSSSIKPIFLSEFDYFAFPKPFVFDLFFTNWKVQPIRHWPVSSFALIKSLSPASGL